MNEWPHVVGDWMSALHRWFCVRALALGLALLAAPGAVAQDLRVNEAVSGGSRLLDRDGDPTDWVEIFNPGPDVAQLFGMGLSDDPSNPFRWEFPSVELEAGGYLVVRASGKDRKGLQGRWESVVQVGDTLRYHLGQARIPLAWNDIGFDDSDWLQGPSGIGYGDGDDATQVPATLAVFARRSFQISDPAGLTGIQLHLDYDDAFVAYLNGVEIGRDNIGTVGIPVSSISSATSQHEARLYQGLPLTGIEIDPALLRQGENVLAVQVHNNSQSSSDLTLIPYLSLGWTASSPDFSAVPEEIRDDFLRPLHTSFKLAADETICVTSSDAASQSCLDLEVVPQGTSVGLRPDGSRALFATPTPGSANVDGVSAIGGPVTVTPPGGIFEPLARARLSAAGGRVVYTLDGSEPDESSPEYTGALSLTQTTVVRARVVGEGLIPGPIATHTFAIRTPKLPVLSLTFEPRLLFEPQGGLYVHGPGASSNFPYFGANFWEDREVEVFAEFLEPDGRRGMGHDVGFKIFGGWSRGHSQRSFSLFARGRYGVSEFEHRFFPDRPQNRFQAVTFRNSGNDWGRSHLRDGFMQSLLDGTAIDRQAYRPAVVYFNGEYWGIHNLREKVNEHYVAGLWGVDPDGLDLLEFNDKFGGANAIHGTEEAWDALIDRVSAADMASAQALIDVGELIDLENYIDYHLAQIFFDNRDWPGNNVKIWRDRLTEGRFRWMLYDTDFGWGIWDENAWGFNTLAFALETNGPTWPNPPWATYLLRRLLLNPEFEAAFVTRMADFANHQFQADRIVAQLDVIAGEVADEMPAHSERWGHWPEGWAEEIARMRTFGIQRTDAVTGHFATRFGLFTRSDVRVRAGEGGRVQVNRLLVDGAWTGAYWDGVPVTLTAIPAPGYRFIEWVGTQSSDQRTLIVNPENDVDLAARFELDPGGLSAIVINEIQYNPAGTSGEWVELMNAGTSVVDLSGWQLGDDTGWQTLPSLSLDPGGLLVLCENAAAFQAEYGTACTGDWPFVLSNAGERIQLVDAGGVVADSVHYSDDPPWPSEPDGQGYTLSLVDASLDNNLASSWRPSRYPGGSPGSSNVVLTNTEEAVPVTFTRATLFPNPAGASTNVSLSMARPGSVSVEVFDVLGRRVHAGEPRSFGVGLHVLEGVRLGTAPGVYLVRVTIDGVPLVSQSVIRAR